MAVAPLRTVWNPLDKSAGVILTDANNTAQVTTNTGVRGTTSHSTGRWYFTITHNGGLAGNYEEGYGLTMGIANSTIDMLKSVDWNNPNQRSILTHDGSISPNAIPYGARIFKGSVVGFAVDIDAKTLKFSVDGVFIQGGLIVCNTLPTGHLYPWLSWSSGANYGIATLNCRPTNIPSGYKAWDDVEPTPPIPSVFNQCLQVIGGI